jgi:hypothetical protein
MGIGRDNFGLKVNILTAITAYMIKYNSAITKTAVICKQTKLGESIYRYYSEWRIFSCQLLVLSYEA